MYAWGKKGKMLVFTGVYVCVKAKLTFVSFFSPFFCTFPLGGTALTQYSAGIHSSGHVLLDNKTLCGEVWDFAASQVVYMRVYLEQLLHI